MSKVYQPVIIEKVEEIIKILDESEFFKDYDITNMDFIREYLSDNLTQKFIIGNFDIENDELFSEDEFEKILKEMVVGTLLEELKQKGVINSYGDETMDEEVYFLTEEGKKHLENLKKEEED